MKIAFLFAGQGAQKVGMGKDFYDSCPEIRAMYDENTLDFNVADCCFNGPDSMLNDTAYAQACLLLTSIVMAECLKKHGITPDVCAGLSLGEYTALTYSGVFTVQDALTVVRKRGELMAHALPEGTGKMVAVMGTEADVIQEACHKASEQGVCGVANYNCPGQIVITGETNAVNTAVELLKEKGVRRMIPLKVSGAFHSALLKDASLELKAVLETVEMHEPQIPIVYNVSGDYESRPIKDLLVEQIYSSVWFEKSIRKMIEDGVDTFVEIGPGKACSGFVKKIDKNVTVLNVEDMPSFEKTVNYFKELN